MTELKTIPYIGKAMVRDFDQLGIHSVEDLRGHSHQELFDRLCVITNSQQDPCVLDTFEMAVHFADTGEALPWWDFSRKRKEQQEKAKS